MSILDRYLLRGLMSAWLTGLAVFVGFLMVGEVFRKGIELLFALGAPLPDVLRWSLLALPNLVAWSLPIATLFAAIMTIGRMSHDLEITAMLAVGISFVRLLLPIGVMAAGISMLSFWLNAFVVPPTYGAADALLWRYRAGGGAVTDLEFREPPKGPPRLIGGAERFNPKTNELQNVWLLEKTDKGERVFLQAAKAKWHHDRWEFHEGFMQIISPDKPIAREHFDKLVRPTALSPPTELSSDRKRFAPNRLTLSELTAQIRRLKNWSTPEVIVNEYVVEWHNRFALALGCLILAMLGAPIALWLRRGGGIAIGISIVLFLVYYLVWNIGCQLGETGQLPPMLSSHLANLLGIAGTIWLLAKLR